jgi:hypothetical protein
MTAKIAEIEMPDEPAFSFLEILAYLEFSCGSYTKVTAFITKNPSDRNNFTLQCAHGFSCGCSSFRQETNQNTSSR